MTAARWQVRLVRPQDGKVKTFSTHANRKAAEVEAGKLRRHGFWTLVRRVADPDADLLPRVAT